MRISWLIYNKAPAGLFTRSAGVPGSCQPRHAGLHQFHVCRCSSHLTPGTTIMDRVRTGGSRVKSCRRNLRMFGKKRQLNKRSPQNKRPRNQATLPQNVDGTIFWQCSTERSKRCLAVMTCTFGKISSANELYVKEILKIRKVAAVTSWRMRNNQVKEL